MRMIFTYIFFLIVLHATGFIGTTPYPTIRINSYENIDMDDAKKIDSINSILNTKSFPFYLTNENCNLVLNTQDNIYSIHIVDDCNAIAYSLYSISQVDNYYLIYITEYLVGYDLCFIYDGVELYKTPEFNLNNEPFRFVYSEFNHAKKLIVYKYLNTNTTETISYEPCQISDINL